MYFYEILLFHNLMYNFDAIHVTFVIINMLYTVPTFY